jgi:formylglycine-generating enzyme required for sulfatase activity
MKNKSSTDFLKCFRKYLLITELTVSILFPLLLACAGGDHADPPKIHAFDASLGSVSLGESVLLCGRFANGNGRVEPEVGPVQSGAPIAVKPKATTTYVLRVTDGQGRTAKESIQVVVKPGLSVRIVGCDQADAEVTIEGPGGFSRILKGSAILSDLDPGEYTVTAFAIGAGATRLRPLHAKQKAKVETGTEVTVKYLAPTLTVLLDGGVPLEFVLIPEGEFVMGSDTADSSYYPSPRPAHRVKIPEPFYMARYPVTQAQWQAVLGDNPATLKDPAFPVNSVSYTMIQERFLPVLNEILPGHGFGLPTEAEWEYACRAGTAGGRFFEPEGNLEDFAWIYNDSGEYLHPVGQKCSNPWGLYDLSGQVYQWCQDFARNGYDGAPEDGSAWLTPDRELPERIVRGFSAHLLRRDQGCSFERWSFDPGQKTEELGFRMISR